MREQVLDQSVVNPMGEVGIEGGSADFYGITLNYQNTLLNIANVDARRGDLSIVYCRKFL